MDHLITVDPSIVKTRKKPPGVSSVPRGRKRYGVSSDAWDDFMDASFESVSEELGSMDSTGNAIHTGHLDEHHAIIADIGDVLFKPTSNDLNHLAPGIYALDVEAAGGYASFTSSGSAIEYAGEIMFSSTD